MPASFPGLSQIVRWSFTLAHGISPSVAVFDVIPQASYPSATGTLVIPTSGGPLTFTGCAVDRASIRRSSDGMLVSLVIYDRRWRWRYGTIRGCYNQRNPDGDLEQDTEKTPQQLATLLLQALNESGFNVSDLPNDARPEINWNNAQPAIELDRLCESLGCRVVLGTSGNVSLCRLGTGMALPNLGIELRESVGIDPSSRPATIRVVGDTTLFQTRFRLEAVGEETDGRLRPIADLSYRPTEGWQKESLGFGNLTNASHRRRAHGSVYRWYRILCTAPGETSGDFQIPGSPVSVTALWQLLPLINGLIQTETGPSGKEQRRPAVVDGIYFPHGADGANVSANRPVTTPFDLDVERGLVRFHEPIFRRGNNDTLEPAELYLTVAHPVRRSNDRHPICYERDRSLAGSGTGIWVTRRLELVETVIGASIPESGSVSTNTANPERNTQQLQTRADAIATLFEATFGTVTTADVEYAGLIPISPDGAIHQVEWSEGPQGATTRASRHCEFATRLRSHEERRHFARQRENS